MVIVILLVSYFWQMAFTIYVSVCVCDFEKAQMTRKQWKFESNKRTASLFDSK